MAKTSIQSMGGRARAKALSAEQRREIASEAAAVRWKIPRATHEGSIEIDTVRIPCAVLEDGTRILTQWGFLRAIGRSGRPAAGRGSDVEKVAPFLALENLKPYISKDLADSTKPIVFRAPRGGKAFGYKAELLPKVCEVYLKARDDGVLLKSQEKFAVACDVLIRGLAHIGIVALVDEATGYQEIRDKIALQKILEKFISKELLQWTKRFPDEFYQQMFRLKGWQWQGMQVNRPQVVGHYTNNIVYERLAPGVLDELRRLNPPDDSGHRLHKHHQWLTQDIGHPKLRDHINGVLALMRATQTWGQFKKLLNKAFPKRGATLELDLND